MPSLEHLTRSGTLTPEAAASCQSLTRRTERRVRAAKAEQTLGKEEEKGQRQRPRRRRPPHELLLLLLLLLQQQQLLLLLQRTTGYEYSDSDGDSHTRTSK